MLKTLIEKEIRDLVGSTKFAITFGACAVLIIASFYAGGARYDLYRSQMEASKAAVARQIGMNNDWNAVGEATAFLPPHPLATLVSGVSNDIGHAASVRGRGQPAFDVSRYGEDPIYAVFQFLDLEFLFKVILSLFAILLGYDAVSGEKEQGTLRLSFSNAVPRHRYLLGKMIGGAGVMGVSLLIALILGALLLPLMGVPMAGNDWLRLGLIVVTGFLYFGVFLTLSVMVSALTHRSSSSFLVLLVVWIASVLIIPRASVLLAGRAVDVPSVDEISSQKARYSSQLQNEYLDGLGQMSIDMAGPEDDPIKKLNTYMDSLTNIRETKMDEFSGRLDEQRQNRQVQQSRLAFAVARLSPTTSLTMAISNLAGTSLALKDHFYEEARSYSSAFGEFKREKTGFNSGVGMRMVKTQEGGEPEPEPERLDPAEMPEYQHESPRLSTVLAASATDIGLLAVFNLLFFAGAFVAFSRYDVR
jgi:ABC-type transport system involved in multi-copper enzyme maturation permease subunit